MFNQLDHVFRAWKEPCRHVVAVVHLVLLSGPFPGKIRICQRLREMTLARLLRLLIKVSASDGHLESRVEL